MPGSRQQIPHALEKAYAELTTELEKGIEHFKETLKFSNSFEVCQCIERFVDVLGSSGREELQRRAGLVESLCGPGSDYHTARAEALERTPRNFATDFPRWLRLRVESLLNSGAAPDAIEPTARTTPIFLEEISEERDRIERLLNCETVDLSDATRRAYQEWRKASRIVQREARPLEVDGCWYVFNIHQYGEDSPTDRAELAKLWTETDPGAAKLEFIKAAADSLFRWVTMHAESLGLQPSNLETTAGENRARPKRKRGGQRLNSHREKEHQRIMAEVQRNEQAGKTRTEKELAEDLGISLKELQNAKGRERRRRQPRNSSTD